MKKILFILLAAVAIVGCQGKGGNGKKTSLFGRTSIGTPYELLVVCNYDLWDAPAGQTLKEILTSDIPGLPQSEPSFRVSQVSPSAFTQTFKPFRNIIDVKIDPALYTQSKFKYTRDKYAEPQMVLTIQSPNAREFQEFVTANGQTIIDFFTSAEMNRELEELKKDYQRAFLDSIRKKFDCDMHIPTHLTAIKSAKDFLWASDMNNAGKETIENIVVYSFPYTDVKVFTREKFIEKRSEILKKHIRGGREDRYMTTDTLLSDTKDTSFRDRYMLEARGLWAMENDMMGGPFVSHAFVDEVNGKVIVAEAFVYAPSTDKRKMMRKLEAALFSLKLPADRQIENSMQIPVIIIEDTIKNDTKN